MKKLFVCIFTLVIVISIFYAIMHTGRDLRPTAETVLKAFRVTGAETAASEIYVRGKSGHTGFDENRSLSFLKEIVSGIGAWNDAVIPLFCPIDTDFASGHEINYIIDENKKIQMTILENKEPDAGITLLISLFDISRDPELQKHAETITSVLDKYGIDHEINISITGSVEGKLGDKETTDIFDRAMKSAGALRVEGISDNGLVSVSAFSPQISEAAGAAGKRVNLNMAARYNSLEDRTYIWIASPVITTEY
jgi:hypothetical protein